MSEESEQRESYREAARLALGMLVAGAHRDSASVNHHVQQLAPNDIRLQHVLLTLVSTGGALFKKHAESLGTRVDNLALRYLANLDKVTEVSPPPDDDGFDPEVNGNPYAD